MTEANEKLHSLNQACGGLLVALGKAMLEDEGVTIDDIKELHRQLRQAVELCRLAIEAREAVDKEQEGDAE